MYFISSIDGDRYGITDTKDNVEEFYSKPEVIEFSKKLKIHGVLEDTIKVFNLEALVLKYKLAGQGFKYIINGDDIILTEYIGTASDFVVPDFITKIGEKAFSDCKGLTSIDIPNSVTSIGNFAFSDCKGLTSIDIPNSVTSIENRVFSGCSSLTTINIPDSVTSIGDYVFKDCSNLATINIPDGVTSIEVCAFSDCNNLKEIEIPEICKCDSDSFPEHTKVVIRRA